MERLKLLIAEGTEDFRIALAENLRDMYTLQVCSDGVTALACMQSFQPDAVILDLMLPGLDGITLLQRASELGLRPIVLATTRFHNDYVVEAAQSLGVAYMMVKPCDVRATVSRLADLCRRLHRRSGAVKDPRIFVSDLLLTMGFSAKLKGFGYLQEAVLLMAEDPQRSITKVLYPAVAAIYKKENTRIDATQVERSIRNAIESAWERRDDRLWRQYFGCDRSCDLRRPSNGAFIIRISDILHREMEK